MFIKKLACIIRKSLYLPVITAHWSYAGKTGPEHWDCLGDEYHLCGKGTSQSPVDIVSPISKDLPKLVFNYKPKSLEIDNNGHSIQVWADEVGSIKIDGEISKLLQFHFHTPSEHAIEGKRYAMVAHFVHQNDKGRITVVSTFFEIGKANPVIQTLFDEAPTSAGQTIKDCKSKIDINPLLPEDKSYYTLDGSLTTPPCSEGVRWILLKQPLSISAEQLVKYPYPNSARPLQPLNDRKIYSST
jgi:carbonic anhydrase